MVAESSISSVLCVIGPIPCCRVHHSFIAGDRIIIYILNVADVASLEVAAQGRAASRH